MNRVKKRLLTGLLLVNGELLPVLLLDDLKLFVHGGPLFGAETSPLGLNVGEGDRSDTGRRGGGGGGRGGGVDGGGREGATLGSDAESRGARQAEGKHFY